MTYFEPSVKERYIELELRKESREMTDDGKRAKNVWVALPVESAITLAKQKYFLIIK